jgi:hypothetical protein
MGEVKELVRRLWWFTPEAVRSTFERHPVDEVEALEHAVERLRAGMAEFKRLDTELVSDNERLRKDLNDAMRQASDNYDVAERLRNICGECANGRCQYHEVERLREDVHRLVNERAEECLAKEEAVREVEHLREDLNDAMRQASDNYDVAERLRAICGPCAQGTCQYHEVERLRAERDAARATADKFIDQDGPAIEAEVERLRTKADHLHFERYQENIARVKAEKENEFLRAIVEANENYDQDATEKEVERLREELQDMKNQACREGRCDHYHQDRT